MPSTATKTAKPESVARRDRRHRARAKAPRSTGRPAKIPPAKADSVVFSLQSRVKPKRPNYRKLLEGSIEREANWKQLVEQMEARVSGLEDRVGELEEALTFIGQVVAPPKPTHTDPLGMRVNLTNPRELAATTIAHINKLEDVCAEQVNNLIEGRDTIALLTQQGYHVKGLYAALLQRYVGVKLDQQLFNLPQAQAFVDRETVALEAALESLKRDRQGEQVTVRSAERIAEAE